MGRLLSLAIVLAALLSGCVASFEQSDDQTDAGSSSPSARAGGVVRGSGVLATEQRRVDGFEAVKISGIGQLRIDFDGTESLTLEAEDNLLPLLRSRVVDRELILDIEPGTTITATEPIVFRLSVAELSRISTSGSPEVVARGLIGDRLVFDLAGSSKVEATGKIDSLTIEVSGSSSFDAASLEAERASVDVSGSAEVVLNVVQELDVSVSGAAEVRYTGDPELTQSISGAGSISRAR